MDPLISSLQLPTLSRIPIGMIQSLPGPPGLLPIPGIGQNIVNASMIPRDVNMSATINPQPNVVSLQPLNQPPFQQPQSQPHPQQIPHLLSLPQPIQPPFPPNPTFSFPIHAMPLVMGQTQMPVYPLRPPQAPGMVPFIPGQPFPNAGMMFGNPSLVPNAPQKAFESEKQPQPFSQENFTSSVSSQQNQPQSQNVITSFGNDDWAEVTTNDGKMYWFHKKTRETTWEKPDSLKTEEEKLISRCKWQEFTSDEGKKYYFNRETKESKWEMPKEYHDMLAETENLRKEQTKKLEAERKFNERVQEQIFHVQEQNIEQKTSENSTPTLTPMRDENIDASQSTEKEDTAQVERKQKKHKNPKNTPKKPQFSSIGSLKAFTLMTEPIHYDTKEDAVRAYKELLNEAGVNSETSWEHACKHVQEDSRFLALRSLGERRQIFSEYTAQKRKIEREEEQRRISEARLAFIEMLTALQLDGQISSRSSWHRTVIPLIKEDPRYEEVGSDKRREDIWEDFRYELGKHEKVAEQEKKENAITRLRTLLKEFAKSESFSSSITWNKIKESEPFASESNLFKVLSSSSIEQEIDVYRKELEKIELEERRKKENEVRALNNKIRNDFEEMLQECVEKKQFTFLANYHDVEPLIKDDKRYQAVFDKEYKGSGPETLFRRFTKDRLEGYRREKETIAYHLRNSRLVIDEKTTYEVLYDALTKQIGEKSIIYDEESNSTNENEKEKENENEKRNDEKSEEANKDKEKKEREREKAVKHKDSGIHQSFVRLYYHEIHNEWVIRAEKRRKETLQNKKKFYKLLKRKKDLFSSSTQYEDMSKILHSHNVYKELSRSDRYSVFKHFMNKLFKQATDEQEISFDLSTSDENMSTEDKSTKKRARSPSPSSSHHTKRRK